MSDDLLQSYREIRSDLKTGDLILFSGDSFFSGVIQLATKSRWSHVGIIYRDESQDIVFLFQSHSLKFKDVSSGRMKRGVQLNTFSSILSSYHKYDRAKVAVRHLNQPVTKEREQKFLNFRKSVEDRDYESNELEILKAGWDGYFGKNKEEDWSGFFCSELVAEAYQAMDILKSNESGSWPSNEYTPADFSQKYSKYLDLNAGYGFGDEIFFFGDKN